MELDLEKDFQITSHGKESIFSLTDYLTKDSAVIYSQLSFTKQSRTWLYTICAPDSGHYSYEFPDSTKVDLAPGTEIEYSSKFLGDEPYLVVWGKAHIITKRKVWLYVMNEMTLYQIMDTLPFKIDIANPIEKKYYNRVAVDASRSLVFMTEISTFPHCVDRQDNYALIRIGVKHLSKKIHKGPKINGEPILVITPVLDESDLAPEPLVSLHFSNKPFFEALKDLREHAGYEIIYEAAALKLLKPVTISIDNIPWSEAISLLFQRQDSIRYVCDRYGKKIEFGRKGANFPNFSASNMQNFLTNGWKSYVSYVFPMFYGMSNFEGHR